MLRRCLLLVARRRYEFQPREPMINMRHYGVHGPSYARYCLFICFSRYAAIKTMMLAADGRRHYRAVLASRRKARVNVRSRLSMNTSKRFSVK